MVFSCFSILNDHGAGGVSSESTKAAARQRPWTKRKAMLDIEVILDIMKIQVLRLVKKKAVDLLANSIRNICLILLEMISLCTSLKN